MIDKIIEAVEAAREGVSVVKDGIALAKSLFSREKRLPPPPKSKAQEAIDRAKKKQ